MRPRFMNKETQNVLATGTISETTLVSSSKDTAGDIEKDKQKYDPDMEKVC